MTAFSPYLVPTVSRNQRIDPAKVLLIINSDSALSPQVADYYQTARGLGGHRLSFALGSNPAATIASTTRYQDIVVPVANYIAAHGIEAVILSAECPAKMAAGDNYPVSAEAVLGAARYWQGRGSLGVMSYGLNLGAVLGGGHHPALNSAGGAYDTYSGLSYSTGLAGGSPVTPDGNAYDVAMQLDPWWLKQAPLVVPWGRIGYPAYGGALAERFVETKRMIDDCIWAEQQPAGPRDYFAMIADYSGNGRHQWQWYAWQMMQAAGHYCRYAMESNTGLNGAAELAWFGKHPDIDWAAFKAGAAPVAADCYLGSIIRNLAVGDVYANSLTPKRGAWAFNWTSSGNFFVANLIAKGGCAGIGPAMEPYNVGMPDDGSVLTAALRGYSLMEINWLVSPASWAMTAWGDPLYRPFPAPEINDGLLMTLTNATPSRTASVMPSNRTVTAVNTAQALTNTTPQRTATWQP